MQSDLKLARLSAFKQLFIVGSIVRIFCLHILSSLSAMLWLIKILWQSFLFQC